MSSIDEDSHEKLLEIDEKLISLNKNVEISCDCNKHLEIKLRQFGGGKHYVNQCNACGEQRGGSIKFTEALAILKGLIPREFDSSIEENRRIKSRILSEQIKEYLSEKSRLKIMLYGDYDWLAQKTVDKEIQEKASNMLLKNTEDLVMQFGVKGAIGFLVRETVRLKKIEHDKLKQQVNRFSSEQELKEWLESYFSKDFLISREVKGRHLAEDVKVSIDYLLKPRPHLVTAGFDNNYFGLEVKYFRQEDGFTHKTSRGIWQTISYNDCEFYINEVTIKPKFSLLFSNLSFEDELQLVKSYGFEFENDKFEWRGMLHLANHANVGCLNIEGTRDDNRGWKIRFVGGVYFSSRIYQGRSQYNKSNENVINKLRIGNF